MARRAPEGIAHLALSTASVLLFVERSESNFVQAPAQHLVPPRKDNVIPEEDDDVSAIKVQGYDSHDPDVRYLDRVLASAAQPGPKPPQGRGDREHEIPKTATGAGKASAEPAGTAGTAGTAEAAEEEEEATDRYVKLATEEEDEDYLKFEGDDQKHLKPATLRDCKSAYLALVEKRLPSARPQAAVERPTTVPTGSTQGEFHFSVRKSRRGSARERRRGRGGDTNFLRQPQLQTSQSVKQFAFGVVGHPATLSSRSPTLGHIKEPKPHVLTEDRVESRAESLHTVVISRTLARPATANKKIGSSQPAIGGRARDLRLPVNFSSSVARTPMSGVNEDEVLHQRSHCQTMGTLQQLNLITGENNADGIKATVATDSGLTSSRPRTARAAFREKGDVLRDAHTARERPTTARVLQLKSPHNYIATSYMRPFGGPKRPVSAAVNTLARHSKEKAQHINPERTKERYMRCLEELEKQAKQFVIEDEADRAEGAQYMAAKDQKARSYKGQDRNEDNQEENWQEKDKDERTERQGKRKTLLHHAKSQRRCVRLKKKRVQEINADSQDAPKYVEIAL